MRPTPPGDDTQRRCKASCLCQMGAGLKLCAALCAASARAALQLARSGADWSTTWLLQVADDTRVSASAAEVAALQLQLAAQAQAAADAERAAQERTALAEAAAKAAQAELALSQQESQRLVASLRMMHQVRARRGGWARTLDAPDCARVTRHPADVPDSPLPRRLVCC